MDYDNKKTKEFLKEFENLRKKWGVKLIGWTDLEDGSTTLTLKGEGVIVNIWEEADVW